MTNSSGYVKSPLNYTGGKYKLLPQIVPIFPKEINMFVDLFGGGGDISANVCAKKIIYNDTCYQIVDLIENIYKNTIEQSISLIREQVLMYGLNKTNEEGYYKLRNDYNSGNRQWYNFYTLICYSFNHQIRFNKKGDFNMPFGKNRSSFNKNIEKNFIMFSKEIKNKNMFFINKDFRDIKIERLNKDDFVYLDPPYLTTCASYNEGGGWTEKEDLDMFTLCDSFTKNNIKFALSNVFEHKGNKNALLVEWGKKYNVHYLNFDYNNCNYQSNNKKHKTIEVLITNY